MLLLLLPVLMPGPVAAQDPAAVGFTVARAGRWRPAVTLSGTVQARRSSLVAAEVAGLVVELASRDGDRVERGAVLARLRAEPFRLTLQARQAALQEAEARLDLADRELQRARELHDAEILSRRVLDQAVSELTAWQSRVANLQAEIDQARDDLARSHIPAPYTGVVVREHTDEGEWIARGDPVLELVDLEQPQVVVEAPEQYFADLRLGGEAAVTFDALPGLQLHGVVDAVIPQADVRARTVPVKIGFDNRDHRVAIGMLATVALPLGEATDSVVVPKDALVRQGEEILVYRITGGETVEQVPVTTGTAAGEWIEVYGGVGAGDRIITRGNERLRPGLQVTATEVTYELP